MNESESDLFEMKSLPQQFMINNKKIKQINDIEKKYLERRRVKLKENMQISQNLISKFKFLPQRLENSPNKNTNNTIKVKSFLKTERKSRTDEENMSNASFAKSHRIKSVKNEQKENDHHKINLLKTPNIENKTRELFFNTTFRSSSKKPNPYYTFYSSTYTPVLPCYEKTSEEHLNKFKRKIQIRKIILDEEIYPIINDTEPDSFSNREKLVRLLDLNKKKNANKNTLPLFNSYQNIEAKKRISLKKPLVKDDLKEYNLKLIKNAQGKLSEEGIRHLQQKLKENYITSKNLVNKVDSRWNNIKARMDFNPDLGYLTNLIKIKFQ